MPESGTVVLDVGKTHAKLSLWSGEGGLLAREIHANASVDSGPYRALDTDGIEAWLATTLSNFSQIAPITHIIPVGHGAAAAVIRQGALACAPLDYEQPIPPDIHAQYLRLRDPFEHTGSPALPNGLNLGAQLYWLESLMPSLWDGDAAFIPWAQYWAWVLCGVAASELTSLGCHTDLWRPREKRLSDLAMGRGWAKRLAPLRAAHEVLGRIRPEWVRRTGLAQDTRVLCGLHDSNAALLAARGFAEISDHDGTVVSTGTWFLGLRSDAGMNGASHPALPAHRDCLINVDVQGRPVPSARFMGGREIDLLCAGEHAVGSPRNQAAWLKSAAAVIQSGGRVLPTLAPGVGPYPHARHRWDAKPSDALQRQAAIELYAALLTDTCLDLIGTRDRILIEGRFAAAAIFPRALAALRPQAQVFTSEAADGVAYGALRLLDPHLPPPGVARRVVPLPVDCSAYREAWRHEAGRLDATA